QVAKRWQQSPFFPRLGFTTAHAYLQSIREQLTIEPGMSLGDKPAAKQPTLQQNPPSSSPSLLPTPYSPLPTPIWNNELYLEFHRGCYTTHADQKRWNRRCEGLLYQAELFASLATLTAGSSYPKFQLEEAWKKVLFNQFHDILPGTSIPEVFVEANQAWQEVEQVGLEILEESLKAIASQIALPSPPQPDAQPLIVFNPLNWQRSEFVSVSLPQSNKSSWVYNVSGQKILSQLTEESTLVFLAKDIPSVGYRVFWLCHHDDELYREEKPCIPLIPDILNQSTSTPPLQGGTEGSGSSQLQEDWVLENELLRAVVDPNTGDLNSVFDKIYQREVLSGAGNQLQAFQDKGQYWDAWNIDPNYAQHPLPPTQLKSIEWVERGVVRSCLRVVRQLGQSQFCQDYVLEAGSPLLKIVTTVDWQERHVLVKAAFPLNLEANYATYEIACGAIKRPTQPQTPAEQAKWEVPALRWADLGDETYGVSLLNDCKYGYDAQSSQLRLTLLRSPSWPDPEADRGIHRFTYAVYPHSGSWQSAGTVHRGYELNLPLQVLLCESGASPTSTRLTPVGQLLDLQAKNIVLMAFKQSEDASNHWILRCYECHGEPASLWLKSDLDLAIAHLVDLLERPVQPSELLLDKQSYSILPWKIATFMLTSPKSPS
ncbi:MAG TPA: glycoside hydrolase family 38 C-terminal domain-containing protein, partial [Candidatus Sericytochromatia bacterium]